MRVRFPEGTQHGYLALRTEDGKRIGTGELVQVIHGDRVQARLVYRLLDGSIDDENAVFTQKGTFHLLTDRHLQKGPSFPHPSDVSIDMTKGEVTMHLDKDGKPQVQTSHIALPADLANGVIITLMKNLSEEPGPDEVTYLDATPKPRLVKLQIVPAGDDIFRVGPYRRKARCFVVKIQIGGVVGVIAPLIGKQPGDIRVWIEGGLAPSFVREEGAFYVGGPVWVSELTNPSFK